MTSRITTCWMMSIVAACVDPNTGSEIAYATAACPSCTPELFVVEVPLSLAIVDAPSTVTMDVTTTVETTMIPSINDMMLVAAVGDQGQDCFKRGGLLFPVGDVGVDSTTAQLTVQCDCGGAP